jgi:hypothetical protein
MKSKAFLPSVDGQVLIQPGLEITPIIETLPSTEYRQVAFLKLSAHKISYYFHKLNLQISRASRGFK